MCSELVVEDAGLRGIVALMKMRESRLRCFVSTRDCGECFSEYGDDARESFGVGNDVSSGERSWFWRFGRGELGSETGMEDIVAVVKVPCSLVSRKWANGLIDKRFVGRVLSNVWRPDREKKITLLKEETMFV